MKHGSVSLLLAALGLALAAQANAQPRPPSHVSPGPPSPFPSSAGPSLGVAPSADLRAHFGTDIASRLMRSSDVDDRLRGIERAAATHTPEALALLERAAGAAVPGSFDPRMPIEGVARLDPRALLAVVRGLADWTDREEARAALGAIVSAPTQSFATRATSIPSRDPAADDRDGVARVALARQEAGISLAESGDVLSLEALIAMARSGGPGQTAALDALAVHPPVQPLLGGVTLTTPGTIALATKVGDLRSLDAILGALHASDPALRSAAIEALGVAGDARGAEAARASLHDPAPRVRIAATGALVQLSAPDAAAALEALVADDETATDALRLAHRVQGDGVTKAAAARAVASADAELRAVAVAALGQQTSALAIQALTTLAADPTLQGDAAFAIARSPSRTAMGALEGLCAAPSTRRLGARAYFVRRFVRGERSARLDRLLASLATSPEARDRAVGVEALVALGELRLDHALDDANAGVRRAAAMGSITRLDGRNRAMLLERLAVERDEPTRQVLALGLFDAEVDCASPAGQASVSTLTLVERFQAGGPDAPLAALTLARRADDATRVDALLASRDPVIRSHAARGLGASPMHEATGRLSRAYDWEADVAVRRALVSALAMRGGDDADAQAPVRRNTLELARRLDSDALVRWTASRALAGAAASERWLPREVAWLRVVPAPGAVDERPVTAALVLDDGVALPIAFDDDGYALVPGVPPGEARVRLAPRLPAYESPSP